MIKRELNNYNELSRTAQLMVQMDVIQRLLIGVVAGCVTFVIQASGIEADMFKLLVMGSTVLGLSNFFLKLINYNTLVKLYYMINVLIIIALYYTTGIALVIVFEILFEIFFLLYSHIQNHYMDVIKEEINIRDFHATVDGLSTITLLIGMSVGYVLLQYFTPVEVVVYGSMFIRVWDIYIIRKISMVK